MENLVNMIEGILEKSNRIQQNFLDRIEANDLRLSRLEGRIAVSYTHLTLPTKA